MVADAHFLSRAIEPGSVDGVFSLAVLEHLAAPWLVAAEVNRILKLGGLTYHVAPHSWPVHETPNDFWRMSDAGLRALFGPHLGFEVLEAGMTASGQMITHRSLRHPPRTWNFPCFAVWPPRFFLRARPLTWRPMQWSGRSVRKNPKSKAAATRSPAALVDGKLLSPAPCSPRRDPRRHRTHPFLSALSGRMVSGPLSRCKGGGAGSSASLSGIRRGGGTRSRS